MALVDKLIVWRVDAALMDAEKVLIRHICMEERLQELRESQSVCALARVYSGVCVASPGLSGACVKCWEVKVFPSGYFGWGGSLESRYVHSKCIRI